MTLSFEEMADAGLPPQQAAPPNTSFARRLLVALLLLCLIGGGGLFGLKALTKPDLPAAAELLIVEEGEDAEPGVLPHQLDDVTEFPDALAHLKEGAAAPELRQREDQVERLGLVRPAVAAESVAVAEMELVVEVPVVPVATAHPVEVRDLVASNVELGESPSAVRDWGGLILVPDGVKLSRAFSSTVRLSRIEAHPIDGDRLRVWVRIENLTDADLGIRVGCAFSSPEPGTSGGGFERLQIPVGAAVDAYFVSESDGVRGYTILVKRLG